MKLHVTRTYTVKMLQTQHTNRYVQMKGVCTAKLSSSFCSTLPQDKYLHEKSLCSTSYLEFWSKVHDHGSGTLILYGMDLQTVAWGHMCKFVSTIKITNFFRQLGILLIFLHAAHEPDHNNRHGSLP